MTKKIVHKVLTENDIFDVKLFCIECKILGYDNNSSLEKIKWNTAKWIGTYIDDVLISMSGVRPEPDIEEKAYRILFRGVTLPGHTIKSTKDITKTSVQWQHIPYQIELVNDINANFYMTSNVNFGVKSHRLTKYMKNCNDVLFYKKMKLFGVEQIVWKYKNN